MSREKQHLTRARASLAIAKRVLFIEGPDDKAVYSAWLAKIDPLWADRLELIPTGGKNDLDTALPALGNPAEAFALRDRDELDAGRIATLQAAAPNLRVNPARHCLESYFCDPDEVEAALLAKDPARYGTSMAAFRSAVLAARPDWVDNGAMWVTAMRLQADMVSAGYTNYFNNVVPLPADAEIQARLATWSALADAATVWVTFDGLRQAARSAPPADQLRGCVHGKNFWSAVVEPALQNLDRQTDWLLKLAEWGTVPADIDAILRPLL